MPAGVIECLGEPCRRYLYAGDGRKLGDDTDQRESKIIDRMRIEDDLDQLRREGQISAASVSAAPKSE